MKDDEFRVLVAQMRTAQKAYFKTRGNDWLNESKRLERRVDEALKASNGEQQILFGKEGP